MKTFFPICLIALLPVSTFAAPSPAFQRVVEHTIGEQYSAYAERALEAKRAAGKPLAKLTEEEAVAIYGYTVNFYRTVNPLARSGDTKKIQPLIRAMDSGLKKLPVYKGMVVRTTDLPPAVAKEYTKGKVVNFASYTSASTTGASLGTSRFVIQSKSARLLGALSASPEEREVIFPRNTKFKILFKRENKDQTTDYVLSEVVGN